MSPAPAVQRETVRLVVMAVRPRLLALMRLLLRLLPTGDEGRQPLDIAFGGRIALLRTLRLVRRLLRKRLCIARDIGLRLARTVRGIAWTAH